MKKHSIIPIFIPHNGCPNDCVFCNQKNITAWADSATEEQVIGIIERNLGTIGHSNGQTTEIAFFGGSFTGLCFDEQNKYLRIAKKYKDESKIDKIRLSTRPDYINEEILGNLKDHNVDIIELGAQSFDDEVLKLSNRGHDSRCIVTASKLIHDFGFELGIQLMTGLPGDSRKKSLYSANMAVSLSPEMARIYPTVILEDTELKRMLLSGEYSAPDKNEMIETVTEMYRRLKDAGIIILRVGLKSTDLINSKSELIYNDYHPAFRELVEGRIALRRMEDLIEKEYRAKPELTDIKTELCFCCPQEMISTLAGHKKENRRYLEKKYPRLTFRFIGDDSLDSDEIKISVSIP